MDETILELDTNQHNHQIQKYELEMDRNHQNW